MTSIPREAKSMASVSPTGPPPTIHTLVLMHQARAIIFACNIWPGAATRKRRVPGAEGPCLAVFRAIAAGAMLHHEDRLVGIVTSRPEAFEHQRPVGTV